MESSYNKDVRDLVNQIPPQAVTKFARFDKTAYNNSTAPVVDARRSVVLDIFENFNDVFFMFLMFFIGGLFIAGSIQKKEWLPLSNTGSTDCSCH